VRHYAVLLLEMEQHQPHARAALSSQEGQSLHWRSGHQWEKAFSLPDEFPRLAQDPDFWENVDHTVAVFDPICKAIGNLESCSATIATAYAGFIFVRVHIAFAFKVGDQDALIRQLLRRWTPFDRSFPARESCRSNITSGLIHFR
jgi:hypothetical protein